MKNLYILGTAGSGKTAVALGLALKFQEQGYRVAYFKPVGHPAGVKGQEDEDGILMQQVLRLPYPIETIVPFTVGSSYLSGNRRAAALEQITAAYRQVSQEADIIIVGGAEFPYVMGCLGADALTLARHFQAAVLFTVQIKNDFGLDETIFFNTHFSQAGANVLGNIFNNVPRPLLAKTEGVYRPVLAEKGYRTLGIIPSHPEIACPTVAEYYEVLGGEVLTGEDRLDRIVEDVVIGAMTMESALGYLRRSPNKAVITGGDRADIALAALETSTSVLILTGGLYPDVKVIARAGERSVPVILVHYDTFTTIEKISEIERRIHPGDHRSIAMARENIEKYCDWPGILEALVKLP